MLAGETDPSVLADLARGRLKAKRAALEQALVGSLKAHHRFLLSEHLAHMDTLEESIRRVSQEIDHRMQALELADQHPPPKQTESGAWLDRARGHRPSHY